MNKDILRFLDNKYIGRYVIGGSDHKGKKYNYVKGPEIPYKVNSFGFRSKELKKLKKNSIKILYSGCSNTYGEGVFENQIWGNVLANKIKTSTGMDIDNNNIAYSGASIQSIIRNLFGILKITENPDYLFICFPSSSRNLYYDKKHNGFVNCFILNNGPVEPLDVQIKYNKVFIKENNLLNSTTMLFLLEHFCESSNIKLLWTTWDEEDDSVFKELSFNNYVKINKDFENNALPNGELDYWEVGQDGEHPGARWHQALADNFFYSLYGINDEK
jgi:hypothetical protein